MFAVSSRVGHDGTVHDSTATPPFRGYRASVRSDSVHQLRQRIHVYLTSAGLSVGDPSGLCEEQITTLADQIANHCTGDTAAARYRDAIHQATRQLEMHAATSTRSAIPQAEPRAMNPAPAVRLAAPLRLRWWILKAFYPASATLAVDTVSP